MTSMRTYFLFTLVVLDCLLLKVFLLSVKTCILIWESPVANTAYMQELLKALIGFIDVAGLYFALTQLTHRNISQNHKFQAVGLGEFNLSKSYHLNGNILFPSKLSWVTALNWYWIPSPESCNRFFYNFFRNLWPQLVVYFLKKKGCRKP